MTTTRVSHYVAPRQWLTYDGTAIAGLLVETKTAASVLNRPLGQPARITDPREERWSGGENQRFDL